MGTLYRDTACGRPRNACSDRNTEQSLEGLVFARMRLAPFSAFFPTLWDSVLRSESLSRPDQSNHSDAALRDIARIRSPCLGPET